LVIKKQVSKDTCFFIIIIAMSERDRKASKQTNKLPKNSHYGIRGVLVAIMLK